MVGRVSVVGIATGYGLDGPGIKSRWGRDFTHLSRPALGPTSLLYNGYRVFPGGKERPGRDAVPSPPSTAIGHEWIELYLYFPYGPYGLHRSSVPVQGCILPNLGTYNSVWFLCACSELQVFLKKICTSVSFATLRISGDISEIKGTFHSRNFRFCQIFWFWLI